MNREDIEKLLGGHAAGTLTPTERQALFEAALEDQQLFDSLAADEPLRELLQDSAARAQLLAALNDRPAPFYRRLAFPAFGVAAAAALVLMAVFVRHERPKPEPVVVAETRREPVRSFQPPLPVEKSPIPRALPAPPTIPAPLPSSVDTIASVRPPPVPAAPPPPPSAGITLVEQLGANASDAASLKANPRILPTAAGPAFGALQFVSAAGDAASAARLGLRYTVFKRSPEGVLTEVDAQAELEQSDEVVISFETSESGFLSVSQLDARKGLHVLANETLKASIPILVPATGGLRANETATNDLLVRFTRMQIAAKAQAESTGQAGAARAPRSEPAPQQATFHITLKYK